MLVALYSKTLNSVVLSIVEFTGGITPFIFWIKLRVHIFSIKDINSGSCAMSEALAKSLYK